MGRAAGVWRGQNRGGQHQAFLAQVGLDGHGR
jgi:hypothetical protein